MARSFTAANSDALYVESAIVSSPPCTFAAWFNVSNITAAHPLIVIGDKDATQQINMRCSGNIAGDPVRINLLGASAGVVADTTSGYSASTWQHACGVVTAVNAYAVFLNGGSKGSDTTNAGSITLLDRTVIGANALLSSFANGNIAEAAIWDVALTDAEVAILAKGFSPLLVRPQSLVFYAPLVRDNDDDLIGGVALSANGTPGIVPHPRVLYPGHN